MSTSFCYLKERRWVSEEEEEAYVRNLINLGSAAYAHSHFFLFCERKKQKRNKREGQEKEKMKLFCWYA